MALDRRVRLQASAKRVIRRIERIQAAAANAPHELSSWEEEFLSDVKDRLAQHGRAFADPEKGTPGAPLSTLQGPKLWQIQKAVFADEGQAPKKQYSSFRTRRGGGFRRRAD